jgi:hypothetical protein
MNSEQADLKARFGAPPDRDLPPGRHAQHREYLMSRIAHQPPSVAASSTPAAEQLSPWVNGPDHASRSSRFPHRPARRRLLAAVAGGVALAACAAGLTSYTLTRSPGPAAGPAAAGRSTPKRAPTPAAIQQAALAARILRDAATQVARAGVTTEPGPDQWIYAKTVLYEYRGGVQPADENWETFDGSQTAYFAAGQLVTHTSLAAVPGPGVSAWTAWKEEISPKTAYDLLKSLPAQPQALLFTIGKHVQEEGWSSVAAGDPLAAVPPTTRPQAEFDFLTLVLWNAAGGVGAPPAVEAAVFQAMAALPGISVQQGTTDEAGAQAISVSADGYDQLLLDPKTYQVLGLRQLNRGTADIPVTGQDLPAKYRNATAWAALSKAEQAKLIAQAQQKLAKTWPAKGAVLESLAYAKVAEVAAPGDR